MDQTVAVIATGKISEQNHKHQPYELFTQPGESKDIRHMVECGSTSVRFLELLAPSMVCRIALSGPNVVRRLLIGLCACRDNQLNSSGYYYYVGPLLSVWLRSLPLRCGRAGGA